MDFPDIRMIVAHLGHPWEEDLVALIRKAPNMYADISAVHYRPWRYWQAMVTAMEYGVTHKLLLASDFPSATIDNVIAGLRAVNAPVEGTRLPHDPGRDPGPDHPRELARGVPGVRLVNHELASRAARPTWFRQSFPTVGGKQAVASVTAARHRSALPHEASLGLHVSPTMGTIGRSAAGRGASAHGRVRGSRHGTDDHLGRGLARSGAADQADDLGGRVRAAPRERLRHRAHPHVGPGRRGPRRDLDEQRPRRRHPDRRREAAPRPRAHGQRTRSTCARRSSRWTARWTAASRPRRPWRWRSGTSPARSRASPSTTLLGGRVHDQVFIRWGLAFGDRPAPASRRSRRGSRRASGRSRSRSADPARASTRRWSGPSARARRDGINVMVDANSGYRTPLQAVQEIQRLEAYDLQLVEQPIHRKRLADLAFIRQHISTPILADESMRHWPDAYDVARTGAADALGIYVCEAGGILPALQAAAIGEAAGLVVTIGSQCELGIGTAAMAHAAVCMPNLAFESDITGHLRYPVDIINEQLDYRDGAIHPPTTPGLGVTLNEDVLAALAARQMTRRRRRDAALPAARRPVAARPRLRRHPRGDPDRRACGPANGSRSATSRRRWASPRRPSRRRCDGSSRKASSCRSRGAGPSSGPSCSRPPEEILAIRAHLEGLAARLAAEKMTPEEKRRLASELDDLEALYRDGRGPRGGRRRHQRVPPRDPRRRRLVFLGRFLDTLAPFDRTIRVRSTLDPDEAAHRRPRTPRDGRRDPRRRRRACRARDARAHPSRHRVPRPVGGRNRREGARPEEPLRAGPQEYAPDFGRPKPNGPGLSGTDPADPWRGVP